ncbi:MAG: SIS domain-containing protein [Chloroflexi bacterium]|nr:MAG: SIS domain-containing protein [Chloroflexota bacterium]
MTNVPYILDILDQPNSLLTALEQFDPALLTPLVKAIRNNDFDRILITGMGGSLYASYPAWLTLANAGLPALWVDTAELIHHTPALVTSKTLLWIFSQSGKSAEIISAIDFGRIQKPAVLIATVNDIESPLAKAAQVQIPIHAEVEKTVSTRTYVNSLGVGQLAALALLGRNVEAAHGELIQAASAMETYLANWERRVQQIGNAIGFPKRLATLGRGSSLASTYTGALILGEASKFMATPYQAGEFRHGPLELATPDLTALIFAGPQETRNLNLRLLKDLRGYQVNAFWVGSEKNEWQIEIPRVPSIGLPLVEILPLQLLSIHFAQQIGVEPGHFFRTGKITLAE